MTTHHLRSKLFGVSFLFFSSHLISGWAYGGMVLPSSESTPTCIESPVTTAQKNPIQEVRTRALILCRLVKRGRISFDPEDLSFLAQVSHPSYTNERTNLEDDLSTLNAIFASIQLTENDEIDLSYLNLSCLPEEAATAFQKCKAICLSNNSLVTLPETVNTWTAVESLDLSSNSLTSLPETMGEWAAVTTLDLSNNQLTSLPSQIGSCTQLLQLNLTRNSSLETLPDAFANLHLTKLSLPHDMPTPVKIWAREWTLKKPVNHYY